VNGLVPCKRLWGQVHPFCPYYYLKIGRSRIASVPYKIMYDMSLYMENPEDSIKVKTIKVSKVAEYKMNLQKAVAFLYTNNKL
jgi:hypothetical protein